MALGRNFKIDLIAVAVVWPAGFKGGDPIGRNVSESLERIAKAALFYFAFVLGRKHLPLAASAVAALSLSAAILLPPRISKRSASLVLTS